MAQIQKIVATIGDMVEVDDDVEEFWRLDRARVLIRTSWRPIIQHTMNVHIGGEVYKVHIVEENGNGAAKCNCRFRSGLGSSEEIDSDNSDIETPASKVDGALGNEVAPRRPTDNSNDGLSTQGYTPLTIDPNDIEKPLGIDCKQWAHCHTHKARRSEHMHGNEVEPATRSTVVPENNSRDDRPCRAQNKLGDRLEDSTTTTQSFHQKGNDADERCHDMAESNMVKDNQARDPAVDGGGSQIWWALLIVPVLKPKNRFGPTD